MPYGKRTQDLLLYAEIDQRLANIDDQTEIIVPVYIFSRHRSETATTPKLLTEANIPYQIVVEPHDYDNYASVYPEENLLRLPLDNQGICYVRNFIVKHAQDLGHVYCWMLDDDITRFEYRQNGKRFKSSPRPLMSITETITMQYPNVAASCISNSGYLFGHDNGPPLVYNSMVYQCQLLRTDTDIWWRDGLPNDPDRSLQLLSAGWVTFVSKRYGQSSPSPMTKPGGLTDTEYANNGRLQRFQRLVEQWPNSYTIGFMKDGTPRLVGRGVYKQFTQLPKK